MELLRNYQLDFMLCLTAICGLLTVFTLITNFISARRRRSLLLLTSSSTLLLVFDRLSYASQGNVSTLGFFITRISIFLVYFMTLVVIYAFNLYLIDMASSNKKIGFVPKELVYVRVIVHIGVDVLICSQFLGLYYTFDQNNYYHRADAFALSFVFPTVALFLHFMVTIKYFKGKIVKHAFISAIFFMAMPYIAAIAQIRFYGLSLINITIAASVIAVYMVTISDANQIYRKSHEQKIKFLEEKHSNSRKMILQTSEALASAIDAKDRYTNGHSMRVAIYSEMIARAAGKSEEECETIHIAGLLHDIGKIGIPDTVIGKRERLTEAEFAVIKQHPEIGREILSKLDTAPELSLGACYHHERYDGKGYPEGLCGQQIPEVARIIAVADAYDAMTSRRSYRNVLPQSVARSEIAKGIGTQFDPYFALIMLEIIDGDTNYNLRQQV